jgi:hypothetical protein
MEVTESKCRLSKHHEETIDQLTFGMPHFGQEKILIRLDKLCRHLHYTTGKALGIEPKEKRLTHGVVESSSTHRQRRYSK